MWFAAWAEGAKWRLAAGDWAPLRAPAVRGKEVECGVDAAIAWLADGAAVRSEGDLRRAGKAVAARALSWGR